MRPIEKAQTIAPLRARDIDTQRAGKLARRRKDQIQPAFQSPVSDLIVNRFAIPFNSSELAN